MDTPGRFHPPSQQGLMRRIQRKEGFQDSKDSKLFLFQLMDSGRNTLHCLMLWQVIKMVSKNAGRMIGVVKMARSLADKAGSISYLIESLTNPL